MQSASKWPADRVGLAAAESPLSLRRCRGMLPSARSIRDDFDVIARASEDKGETLHRYERVLLSNVPTSCRRALDLGCGVGVVTRALAKRVKQVVALDLSPEMVRIAKSRTKRSTNIEYVVADVSRWVFAPEEFDCIVSVATLHHLPLVPTLIQLRRALSDDGLLLVLDLFRSQGVRDRLLDAVAYGWNLPEWLRRRPSPALAAAWKRHGRNDRLLTLAEIRAACGSTLPNCVVRRRLLWRYELRWSKAAAR